MRRHAEDIAIVRRTVMAAYDAVLPAGCQRTIYLCDDGKDPKKRKFCDGIGPDVRSADQLWHTVALDFALKLKLNVDLIRLEEIYWMGSA